MVPAIAKLRHKFALPEGWFAPTSRACTLQLAGTGLTEQDIYSATLDPKLTWKDIDWLRSLTKLPVILKAS